MRSPGWSLYLPGFASSTSRMPSQIVGTPAANVTRSCSISSSRLGGSRYGPGNTSFAPTIAAMYGKPHALTWNIGTTGSSVSIAERTRASRAAPRRACAGSSSDASRRRPWACRSCRSCSRSPSASVSASAGSAIVGRLGEELLVAAIAADHDHALELAARRDDLLEQRQQHVVDDHEAIAGVVRDVTRSRRGGAGG